MVFQMTNAEKNSSKPCNSDHLVVLRVTVLPSMYAESSCSSDLLLPPVIEELPPEPSTSFTGKQ